jgi:hypothetical protein
VREKLELWREDYKQVRPHSALDDASPLVFAANWARSSAVGRKAAPAKDMPTCSLQRAPASHPEPAELSGLPSAEVKGGAEKLQLTPRQAAANRAFC